MPFCTKCGSQVDEDSRFCRQCGAAIGNTEQSDVYIPVTAPAIPTSRRSDESRFATSTSIVQQKDAKTECLDELDRMIKYFGKKQSKYDEHDKCCENIQYYSNPKTQIFVYGSTGKPFKIIGIILMVIGGIMVEFSSCSMSIARNSTYNYNNSYSSAAGALVFFFILFAIGGALLATGIVKSVKYGNRRRAEKERIIRENKKKCSDIEKELTDYYEKYGNCLTGLSYTNPKILRQLRKLVFIGRADSIKEAINILHQDAHNSEMELQASLTAQHAASAARGAKAAAIFSAADFLLK